MHVCPIPIMARQVEMVVSLPHAHLNSCCHKHDYNDSFYDGKSRDIISFAYCGNVGDCVSLSHFGCVYQSENFAEARMQDAIHMPSGWDRAVTAA